jgi:hypothetical protein
MEKCNILYIFSLKLQIQYGKNPEPFDLVMRKKAYCMVYIMQLIINFQIVISSD